MFVLIALLNYYTCDHEKRPGLVNKLASLMLKFQNKLKMTSSTRRPINILFNYYFIDNPEKDPNACRSIGQISRQKEKTITCTKDDLITEEKKEVVKKTLQNVKKWFKETLNITRFNQAQFEFNSDPTSRDEEHNDLNILVFASPFERGSTTLATAYPFAHLSSDNYEKRPQAGILTINFALLPEKSADINDQSRDLFEILVHETIHILGFSNDLYKNWIDRRTKKPYVDPVIRRISSVKHPGKIFNLLVTPKLQELVTDKFGITEFEGNNSVGVELDADGPHFKSRTYFTELMTSETSGIAKISMFSLGLLYDIGWYDVHFEKAEPFTYGEYRAILGQSQPYTKFAFDAPDSSFPKNYLSTTSKQGCSFDNMFGGSYVVEKYNCTLNPAHTCCKYPLFTDSMGRGICNQKNNLGDYITSIIPNKSKICTKQDQFKDPVNIFKQKYGSESFCAEIQGNSIETTACYEMICSEKNELSILIDGQTLRCDAAGQKIQIPGVINYSVICPNPNIVCGVKRYLKGINNNIQINDQASVRTNVNIASMTSVLVSSQDKEKSQNNLKIIIGCTVGTLVFIVIAIIASIIGYKKRWCRKHASVHNVDS